VREKTLLFRKAQDDQSKTWVLEWGKTLKSFNPTLNTLRPVNAVTVRGYDPLKKEEIIGKAGAGDETSKMGGAKSGADLVAEAFGRTRETVQTASPIASQEEADQLARALYNQRAQEFITGSGATVGLPDLRAGRVIELKGLGPQFSGLYYVTSATHSIGDGGYQTQFNVRRNAV